MDLPDNAVGISDINTYRDCPTRMEFSMRRWTEGSEPPERKHPDIMYGSAIHHGIEAMETGALSFEEAVQAAFDEFSPYLDPSDMDRLEHDLSVYMERDYTGVRAVAVEGEFRVPLLIHEGEQIYYRFKLDRLYERINRPGAFIHIDYKSSKWRKTPKEIREDTQMWSYDWGIHEFFPEMTSLEQIYDQLMYGREWVPRKTDQQRANIKKWLQRQVRAILNNQNPEPKFNEWCPWCALLPDCPEPKRTAQFAASRIAALAPADDKGKLVLDPDLMEVYVEQLPEIGTAKKALDVFEDAVRKVLREMPEGVRTYHGYETFSKNNTVWSPIALAEIQTMLGPEFMAIAKITKTAVNDYFDKDDPRREQILALAEKVQSNPQVRKMAEE